MKSLAGLVLCGLALLSASRVRVWHSDATLWTATVRQMPTNIRALVNYHAIQIAQMDIAGHIDTCQRLRAEQARRPLGQYELWIIDRICLAR